jgi:hypothetical protein
MHTIFFMLARFVANTHPYGTNDSISPAPP